MSPQVSRQINAVWKPFTADGTAVGTLPRVALHVNLQRTLLRVASFTNRAGVGPVRAVNPHVTLQRWLLAEP